MRTTMKPQLMLLAILFIVTGCNNSPDTEQPNTQQDTQSDSSEAITAASETDSLSMQQLIEERIAVLDEEEKLRVAEEIILVKQKILDLESQENDIELAMVNLDEEINQYRSVAASSSPEISAPAKETVAMKTKATEVAQTNTTQPATAADTDTAKLGWGDWEKGIQPAAGPAPTPAKPQAVSAPAINFRANEHSAFARTVVNNTPAGNPVIVSIPTGGAVPTTTPGSRFTRP